MPDQQPALTVLIRAKNEAAYIGQTLSQLFAQEYPHTFRVILIDSGSEDATLEIASQYPVEIIRIPPEDFSYSSALNLGVGRAVGKYFVCLSGDAVPTDKQWLSGLVDALEQDPQVVASFSRQLPREDSNYFVAEQINRTFPGQPRQIVLTDRNREAFATDPYEFSFFSNTSGCIRLAYLKQNPFEELPFAEDRQFAIRALKQGYKLQYVPSSMVFHAHQMTFRGAIHRTRNAALGRWQIRQRRSDLLSILARHLLLPAIFLKASLRLGRDPGLRVAAKLGAFCYLVKVMLGGAIGQTSAWLRYRT